MSFLLAKMGASLREIRRFEGFLNRNMDYT